MAAGPRYRGTHRPRSWPDAPRRSRGRLRAAGRSLPRGRRDTGTSPFTSPLAGACRHRQPVVERPGPESTARRSGLRPPRSAVTYDPRRIDEHGGTALGSHDPVVLVPVLVGTAGTPEDGPQEAGDVLGGEVFEG